MNREQREGHEQGGLRGHSILLRATSSFTAPGSHPGGEGKPLLGIFLEPPPVYWGHSLFLFAVFAHFAVKITTDTPFEKHEPRTTRTARTGRNRPYTLSQFSHIVRLKLQRTLPFPPPLQRTLRYTFEGTNETESSRKILQPTGDTPFFCSRFSRISRLKLQRTLRLKSMNREQRERHEQGETDHTHFRSFRTLYG